MRWPGEREHTFFPAENLKFFSLTTIQCINLGKYRWNVSERNVLVIVLWIGIGGFIGAILRYWISGWVQAGAVTFPAGTLAVNFIGSFFLALVMFLSEFKGYFNEEIRIFLTIGLLGSFTTMSTFSYESFKLLEQQEHLLFSVNIVGSIVLTLLAIYLGRIITLNL